MHDFVALDPSPSPWGSKTNRSGRSWKPQGLRSNRVAAWPLQVGGDPTLLGKWVQEVFPCTPATWRTRVWAAPTVLARPFGGRAVGEKCAVGTHFKGFGLQGTEPALCSLAWLSGDRWAHVGSVAKAAPCALRPPYHLITFKCSCRASPYGLFG